MIFHLPTLELIQHPTVLIKDDFYLFFPLLVFQYGDLQEAQRRGFSLSLDNHSRPQRSHFQTFLVTSPNTRGEHFLYKTLKHLQCTPIVYETG